MLSPGRGRPGAAARQQQRHGCAGGAGSGAANAPAAAPAAARQGQQGTHRARRQRQQLRRAERHQQLLWRSASAQAPAPARPGAAAPVAAAHGSAARAAAPAATASRRRPPGRCRAAQQWTAAPGCPPGRPRQRRGQRRRLGRQQPRQQGQQGGSQGGLPADCRQAQGTHVPLQGAQRAPRVQDQGQPGAAVLCEWRPAHTRQRYQGLRVGNQGGAGQRGGGGGSPSPPADVGTCLRSAPSDTCALSRGRPSSGMRGCRCAHGPWAPRGWAGVSFSSGATSARAPAGAAGTAPSGPSVLERDCGRCALLPATDLLSSPATCGCLASDVGIVQVQPSSSTFE